MTRPMPWLFCAVSLVLLPMGKVCGCKWGRGGGRGCIPVDIKHAKRLDPVLPQDPLLPRVHVPQADVHELPQRQPVLLLQPAKVLVAVLPREPRQERNRHAVHVAAPARLGRVDVGVGVDPDDGDLAAEALARGARHPGHGPDGDAVVAAERQDQAALRRVTVDLVCDAARYGGDGAGVLHAPVGRVVAGRRDEVGVEVDRVVAVELVAELVAELGEEAGLD